MAGKVLEEIVADIFPNLAKYINLEAQGTEQTLNSIIQKKSWLRHIMIKFLKTEDQGNTLKSSEEEVTPYV